MTLPHTHSSLFLTPNWSWQMMGSNDRELHRRPLTWQPHTGEVLGRYRRCLGHICVRACVLPKEKLSLALPVPSVFNHMVELLLPPVPASLSLSLFLYQSTPPRPHLLPTSCNITGSSSQTNRNSNTEWRVKYNTCIKKTEKERGTRQKRVGERVSERGD